MSSRVSVDKAADKMQVTPQFLRMGLRSGRFPFGTAVKMDKRWSYYINGERFRKYMEGGDMDSNTKVLLDETEVGL